MQFYYASSMIMAMSIMASAQAAEQRMPFHPSQQSIIASRAPLTGPLDPSVCMCDPGVGGGHKGGGSGTGGGPRHILSIPKKLEFGDSLTPNQMLRIKPQPSNILLGSAREMSSNIRTAGE